jgi:putative Mn2+ efflux pump MntP
MNFDLRYPVGLMFTLFGALMAVFGLVSDPKLYERSLGININLWWGVVLLAFGLTMLTLAIKAKNDTKP